MAKATTVALGAATAGVAALAKEAIDVYAEYEQLVGGVETLFGDSAGTVMGYAENAYKTAGMSANEYMNTVTSFSASLLQGLGGDTEEAAKVANRAITDMSDNANKMGTSMTLIQNAYQGFAKQNYTMLDNLKLGYGGTQAEMARLINDSGVLGDSFTATANNINEVSFDKIIEAIGVIRDRMGITGTTALEASTTIQGSIASMKAAWQNFLGGMADPTQDFDTLVANLVDSVVTVGENLIPRIQQLLPRLTDGITVLASSFLTYLPDTFQELLPPSWRGRKSLLTGLVSVLPGLLTAALDALPQLTGAATSFLSSLGSAIVEGLHLVVEAIPTALPLLMDAVFELFASLGNGLSSEIPVLADAATSIIFTLLDGIAQAAPSLVTGLVEIIGQLLETLTNPDTLTGIIQAALSIILALVDGLLQAIPTLLAAVPVIIQNLATGLLDAVPPYHQRRSGPAAGPGGRLANHHQRYCGSHSPNHHRDHRRPYHLAPGHH